MRSVINQIYNELISWSFKMTSNYFAITLCDSYRYLFEGRQNTCVDALKHLTNSLNCSPNRDSLFKLKVGNYSEH